MGLKTPSRVAIICFGGFRDIVTVGERSVSRYIVAKSRATVEGAALIVPRQLQHVEIFEP